MLCISSVIESPNKSREYFPKIHQGHQRTIGAGFTELGQKIRRIRAQHRLGPIQKGAGIGMGGLQHTRRCGIISSLRAIIS